MPINNLLNRLEKVKNRANGRYIACCPAHSDKNPSLSISVIDDGRILIKCWAGCEVADIVSAVGLSLSDLFPKTLNRYNSESKPNRKPFMAIDVIECVYTEITISMIIIRRIKARSIKGLDFDLEDMDRLELANDRIATAREYIKHGF